MPKPTPKEVLVFVRDTLRNLEHTPGGNPVFNSTGAFVSPVIPIQAIAQYPTPTCFVVAQGDVFHPEHNQLVKLQMSLITFVEHVGDEFGEASIIGANQTPDSSLGIGLKDLESIVSETFRKIKRINNKPINFIAKSRPKPQFVGQNETLVFGYKSMETDWLQVS